jgi:23S rRNA (adenine-N6)-dimethyltransferase
VSAPRARWSWYSLSEGWAETIVATAGLGSADLVLDIGAGTGALTRALATTGARVVAVEAHPGRAATLRRAFDPSHVKVVEADVSELRLPRRPFRVVANPPFALTTPLLRGLLSPGSQLLSAYLVLQKGAAARWASGRPYESRSWHRRYNLEIVLPIPRSAFSPPPRVDAALLTIRRR